MGDIPDRAVRPTADSVQSTAEHPAAARLCLCLPQQLPGSVCASQARGVQELDQYAQYGPVCPLSLHRGKHCLCHVCI